MGSHSNAERAHTGNNSFLKSVAWISKLSGWCAAGMLLAAVLITCQMIFVRFVLGLSTVWQTEMVVYLMIGSTLLGLPFVQRLRGHVNVDLIPNILKGKHRFTLAVITLLICIGMTTIMLIYSIEHWYIAWSKGWTSDTVWAVDLWKPYLALPVGFGLYLLQLIADLVALFLKIDKPFGLEDV